MDQEQSPRPPQQLPGPIADGDLEPHSLHDQDQDQNQGWESYCRDLAAAAALVPGAWPNRPKSRADPRLG